ncbi:uncharacterized protein DUF3846 [Leucobacter luti]|uniref:Uncharacterized protein DUF3846 n=1 Tax=Leucobacter luti TaxID=340320 RepID=A0A4R6RZ11_9MICO|nr:DUF3846 domain-containing protein [Leucobacter luti]TDP92391.1 uncharacterized protein DUF3846 [Leucobacter luti]
MSEQIHGLRISPRGITNINIDREHSVRRIQEVVGCRMFTVVSLSQDIDLFVDDEALLVAEPELNLPLTVIAHALGSPQVLFGNGFAAGADDETGETVGLTPAQKYAVNTAANGKLEPEVLELLCENLSPWPAVVSLVLAKH